MKRVAFFAVLCFCLVASLEGVEESGAVDAKSIRDSSLEVVNRTYRVPRSKVSEVEAFLSRNLPFEIKMSISHVDQTGSTIRIATRRDVHNGLNGLMKLLNGDTGLEQKLKQVREAELRLRSERLLDVE